MEINIRARACIIAERVACNRFLSGMYASVKCGCVSYSLHIVEHADEFKEVCFRLVKNNSNLRKNKGV